MQAALCIGINDYPGTGSDLAGCVNDADDMAAMLGGRGFTVEVMIDAQATRDGMIAAMTKIVSDAKQGDVVVITYSGHGTWQADKDNDEPDMRDEALCPHDIATKGPLLDDDLFDIFSRRQRGVRLVFLSDSCHSGSVAKMAPPLNGADRATVRFLPPGAYLAEEKLARAQIAERLPAKGLSRGTALLISGCRDDQFSYDANFGGRPNGAFTRAALDTLANLKQGATYAAWHKEICKLLPSANYPQSPQLVGTSTQRQWQVLA